MMKLRFEPNLDFQLQAVEAVCDLFHGQEICRTEFTVTRDRWDSQGRFTFAENDLGIGNRLTLLDEEILANLKGIQLRNGMPPSEFLDSGDFTVEMETGTGKTYVYLRTIFELNKRYGFTKFVIVVPSVAIKEGVYKITADHRCHISERTVRWSRPSTIFSMIQRQTWAGAQLRREPAPSRSWWSRSGRSTRRTSTTFTRTARRPAVKQPIDLIQSVTRPILIVDEPQSVDGGLMWTVAGAGARTR